MVKIDKSVCVEELVPGMVLCCLSNLGVRRECMVRRDGGRMIEVYRKNGEMVRTSETNVPAADCRWTIVILIDGEPAVVPRCRAGGKYSIVVNE